MLRFLSNRRMKFKLLSMLLLPLLALVMFSSRILWENAKTYQEMRNLGELTQLSIKLTNVIHAIQLERGASSLFLKSQGQRFGQQLTTYRQKTDQALGALEKMIKNLDEGFYSPNFQRNLQNLTQSLSQITELRQQVTNQLIDQDEEVRRYTKINNALFQFVITTTHISSYRDIFPLKLAYINLLKAKEKAGIERALLAAVFTQSTVQINQYRQFVDLISAQHTFLNHDVMYYLTEEQKTYLKTTFQGHYLEETQRLREIVHQAALKADGQLPAVNPEHWFQVQTGKIELLKQAGDKISQYIYQKAITTQNNAIWQFSLAVIVVFFTLLIVGLTSWFISRSVTTRLHRAVSISNAIAQGQLNNEIETTTKDEIGLLLQALDQMQTHLHQRAAKDKRIADEAWRITTALDSVTTAVFIVNNDYQLVYANQSAHDILQAEKVKKYFPNTDLKNVVGQNIDNFHQEPLHQRQILDSLDGSYRSKFQVGPLTIDSIVTPVINEQGERIGTVAEWRDISLQQAMEQQINLVIQAASHGDFNQRISLEDKIDFFHLFSQGINQIIDFNQRAVKDTMRMFANLARGDLTQQIVNDYAGEFEQLKNDANATVQRLTDIVQAIQKSAETVNRAAQELSQSNMNLSERTEQQASALQQTAANMQEMTGTVQQNADNAKRATQLASGARKSAEKGGHVIGEAVGAMQEINKSSRKITEIINVIDEIAFQTNLLALNAAVEAARAGEQGRGFAVVAAEVRNLAQRSASAAKEIKALIQDSVEKVEEGTRLVNNSGDTLEEIVDSVKQVSDIISEIAAASQEQSTGISQVNKAVSHMDQMTQQNAAMVGEAAAASKVMTEQMGSLKTQIAFFTISETDTKTSASPSSTFETPKNQEKIQPSFVQWHSDEEWEDF